MRLGWRSSWWKGGSSGVRHSKRVSDRHDSTQRIAEDAEVRREENCDDQSDPLRFSAVPTFNFFSACADFLPCSRVPPSRFWSVLTSGMRKRRQAGPNAPREMREDQTKRATAFGVRGACSRFFCANKRSDAEGAEKLVLGNEKQAALCTPIRVHSRFPLPFGAASPRWVLCVRIQPSRCLDGNEHKTRH